MNLCYKGKVTKKVEKIEKICTAVTMPMAGPIGGKVMKTMLKNRCKLKLIGK